MSAPSAQAFGGLAARLKVFPPSIWKIGRRSDFENIDARWQKHDGREFRLQLILLLTRPLLGASTGGRSSLRRNRRMINRRNTMMTGFGWMTNIGWADDTLDLGRSGDPRRMTSESDNLKRIR